MSDDEKEMAALRMSMRHTGVPKQQAKPPVPSFG